MSERTDTQHLPLLESMGKMVSLLAGISDLDSFLMQTVEIIATHFQAGVCSLYLYEAASEELVLAASHGPEIADCARVRIRVGEGLVGVALKELRPIWVDRASQHPRFKPLGGVDLTSFDTFLAVPVLRGIGKVGVLVVQRETDRSFVDSDVTALRILASQLAGAIENARALQAREMRLEGAPDTVPSLFIRGRTASRGYASGLSRIMARNPDVDLLRKHGGDGPGFGTLEGLRAALNATAAELEAMHAQLAEKLPEAASLVFDAHVMMIRDETFSGKMETQVCEGAAASTAVLNVAREFARLFENSPDPYMKEKARDVEDVALQILGHMRGVQAGGRATGAASVVVANELLPSDILRLSMEGVRGIVMTDGGTTSHVAILVRSLDIPTVIARAPDLLSLPNGTPLLVDGEVGSVYVCPTEDVLSRFSMWERAHAEAERHSAHMSDQTTTACGARVTLLANVNLLSETRIACDMRAEGVGLYRSEFPFMIRASVPSVEEQMGVYRELHERMGGREVTIRTLDAGGDKTLAYLGGQPEANPALGLRSVRLSLKHTTIFEQQIEAIIRAAPGVARIMFPMITSLDEFRRCRELVLGVLARLRQEVSAELETPLLGVMIELPAAVEIIAELADESDFMSVGTNDFTQYMLAADRTNENVASYYCEHHPAVLRGLQRIVSAAIKAGKSISVCGEMAHDERYVPFFLGLGVRRFSVDPHYLATIQAVTGRTSLCDAEAYAATLLSNATISGVEEAIASKSF